MALNPTRFQKIISSDVDAILLVDGDGVIRYVNRAAESIFRRSAECLTGSVFQHPLTEGRLLEIELERGDRTLTKAEMNVSEIEWQVATLRLVALRDIAQGRKRSDRRATTAGQPPHTVEKPQRPISQVRVQKGSSLEEERLSLLLQIAGATAHELNQPLMALLGSIDLMRLHKDRPEKLALNLARIEEAGKQIADIVRKVQTVKRYETKPYLKDARIIDLDQKMRMLFAVDSDEDFSRLVTIASRHPRVEVTRSNGAGEAKRLLRQQRFELILIDSALPNGFGLDLLSFLYEKGIDTPVVVMGGEGDDIIASRLIKAGAYDYLPKGQLTDGAFNRVITNVQEKLRLQREVDEVRKQMAQQVVTDNRTGLYNRRFLMETLEREMSRARRHGPGMVVALIEPELDPNEPSGIAHARRGVVFSFLGKLLTRELRRSDVICRYGFGALAVLFPQTHPQGLQKRLEILRHHISQHRLEFLSSPIPLRVSIALCAFDISKTISAAEFMASAEKALLVAKKNSIVYAAGID